MPKLTVSLCDVCGDHLPGGDIPDGYIASFSMRGWRYLPSERPQPPETFHGAFDVTSVSSVSCRVSEYWKAVYGGAPIART